MSFIDNEAMEIEHEEEEEEAFDSINASLDSRRNSRKKAVIF
jgi:hypothetical protein